MRCVKRSMGNAHRLKLVLHAQKSLDVLKCNTKLRIFTTIWLSSELLDVCNVIQIFRIITVICLLSNLYGIYMPNRGCSSTMLLNER